MEKLQHIMRLDLANGDSGRSRPRRRRRGAVRKTLSRDKVLAFLAEQPRCVVAVEACEGPHGVGTRHRRSWP